MAKKDLTVDEIMQYFSNPELEADIYSLEVLRDTMAQKLKALQKRIDSKQSTLSKWEDQRANELDKIDSKWRMKLVKDAKAIRE
jgi:hypothetical protein